MSTSPSLAGASSSRTRAVGGHDELPLGAVTQIHDGTEHPGMTSPAFRIITVSPISTPLRFTSEALCRVARLTVDPATRTGSMNANG